MIDFQWVIQGADERAAIEDVGGLLQMFTDPGSGDRGGNRGIGGAGLVGGGISHRLGIKGVDMTHSASEPEQDYGLCLSPRRRVRPKGCREAEERKSGGSQQ